MSSERGGDKQDRRRLLAALERAVWESSTAAIFFHTTIAAQFGLGATEEKTLLILSGLGPLTAGEIAQQTGLATASVTSLIDRLEAKGFVRRVRDGKDRRRVIVEPNQERLAELFRLFGSLGEQFAGLFDDYDDEQLAVIADYLTRAAQRSREAVARLNHSIEAGER